tara:strand:+ start:309894 stop:310250 length:357 start_codon:yes stop_codon:yes gene_type:complete
MLQAIIPKLDMCCEFQKMAALYGHYKEHKALDGDSVLDFIVEDYFNSADDAENHHKNSKQKENPVHKVNQPCCAPIVFLPKQETSILVINTTKNSNFDLYNSSFYSAHLATLFQPPRV